ncbi:MAG: DUF4124 domain-containing protein [Luteimonas sp.]|nr:DUF4124 domain-containing protein [Luteimonas sp.]
MIAGLSLLGLAGTVAASEVYQWKDANGVTHYSQTPPPKGQYQQRQITSHGATSPQQSTQAAATPAAVNPQCATARANVEALNGSDPVHEADADGKPGRALGPEERANRLELANAAVKAYCGQQPTD